jgi:ketosteroid isomerase-like protein
MKIPLVVAIVGLAIGFALPALAQEENTVDPEVHQQIEAELTKYDEAYNKNDAAAIAALFTQDAVELWYGASEGGLAFGQQVIEKRYATEFGAHPSNASHKLLQVYAVGNDICAITEWAWTVYKGHSVRIYAHDADTWKIRVAYVN